MKLFCTCGGEFTTRQIGVDVIEEASFGPYKIWSADLLACRFCEKEIIRTGDIPFTEHYQGDFEKRLQATKEGLHIVAPERKPN
jgi:hypothetical protein